MAEKVFKRKKRLKVAAVTSVSGSAAAANLSQSVVSGQKAQVASYYAGPAFGLSMNNHANDRWQDGREEEDAQQSLSAQEMELQTEQQADRGIMLPPQQRTPVPGPGGHDFSGVRLHMGSTADRVTRSLSASAFTQGNHIWLSNRASPADNKLISHELAHVVQQGYAPRLQSRSAISLSNSIRTQDASNDSHITNAHSSMSRSPAARISASKGSVNGKTLQRFSIWGAARRVGSAVSSGVRRATGAVANAAGNLLSMGRSALMAIVRRVAPGFASLFESDGIRGFLRRLVQRGLRSLFTGLTAPMRAIFNFGNIGARISQAMSWIGTIGGQLMSNNCSGILALARNVGDFFSKTFGPFVKKVKSIADKVKGFFSSIWNAIGAPIMNILKNIGGAIWQSLRGFVSRVASVIRTVRSALGSAWSKVKGWFNIGAESGESEGGGLWNWIKDKASSIGTSVANAVRPIIGPLRDVGGVMLLLIPGGQIVGIMLLWPRLKQAFAWIKEKWRDLNLIPRARAFLLSTVIPFLMDSAESLAQSFIGGVDWLLGLLNRAAGYLASALRAATGWFSPLGRVIGYARNQFNRFVVWARSGLRSVSRNFRSLMRRLIEFLQPIFNVLQQLILIVINPFGIVGFLAGTIWRLVPDCLKGPIIDFIVDIIIRFLRIMPPLPQLGLLWPLIKNAMLGFFERVRSFATQRKVDVSKKIARIISGMSPGFILGYFKGMVIGLWEGITAPFMAIAAIFELPSQIQEFLSSMGVRLCELVSQIACFASELAGRVFGTLDEVLSAISDLLQDPARIVELIRCAIEGAMAAARSIGASIADQMMSVFESAEAAIGERLGRIVGSTLVQMVITYFTAGAGAGVAIINRLSGALRMVGRALGQILQVVRRLLGRMVSFVRGFARRIAQGARGVMRRMGNFFRRVAAWFGRLFRRIGRRIGGRSAASRAKRRQWRGFKRQAKQLLRRHRENGITKRNLKTAYRSIARRYRRAILVTYITKTRGRWRLWAAPRFLPFLPRSLGTVKMDKQTRWRAGSRDVRRRMRRVRDSQKNVNALNRILAPLKRRWGFVTLEARSDSVENDFNIMGGMSPTGEITEVDKEDFATRENPLPLSYPKHASSRYPVLFLGPRLGSRNRLRILQSELRAAVSSDSAKQVIADKIPAGARERWEARNKNIERFTPHRKKTLPEHSKRIGIDSNWQVRTGKLLKLKAGGRTPGGGKINRALKPYGFFPGAEYLDGDHVVEIQLGGQDELGNLWPLNASENRSAGSLLSSMPFTKPDGTSISMRELKREAGVRKARDSYVWLRISSTL